MPRSPSGLGSQLLHCLATTRARRRARSFLLLRREQLQQRARVERLADVVVEAAQLREDLVGGLLVAGHRDEERPALALARVPLAHAARYLVAGNVRHADVEQHDLGPELALGVDGLAAAA